MGQKPKDSSCPDSMKGWGQVLPRDLEDIWQENTTQYDLCKDEMQSKQTFPQLAEELEPSPEVGYQYTCAEKMLSRREKKQEVM